MAMGVSNQAQKRSPFAPLLNGICEADLALYRHLKLGATVTLLWEHQTQTWSRELGRGIRGGHAT